MSEKDLRRYLTVLYGLLHDAGKPVRRYLVRYGEGLEPDVGPYADLLKRVGVGEHGPKRHDEISDALFKWFLGTLPDPVTKERILVIIKEVDPIAAVERGVEAGPRFKELSSKIQELLKQLAGRYGPDYTPMITPLWVLKLVNYCTGPCAAKEELIEGFKKSLLAKLMLQINSGDIESCLAGLKRIIESYDLLASPYWLPVKPLSRDAILKLCTMSYGEALKDVSYASVVRDLLEGMLEVKVLFDIGSVKDVDVGVIDTLLSVIRRSFFLVPAAVYGSLLPDTSLYAHSKYVAGLADAEYLSNTYRLLSIDVRGIQRFVSLIVKAGAASKILRGRSLLIELIQDSITRYVLKLFSDLSEASVLTNEGGAVTLVLPNVSDFEARVRVLNEVLLSASIKEFKCDLDFTLAYSEPFDSASCNYLKSLIAGKGFVDVVKSLSECMSRTKALRGAEVLKYVGNPVLLSPDEIKGFDASSKSCIGKDEEQSVCFNEHRKYIEELAPEKFGPGECLDSITHKALVLGHVSRNLLCVIGVHVYIDRAGTVRPEGRAVSDLTRAVAEKLAKISACGRDSSRLYFSIGSKTYGGGRAALVPLPSLGSTYVVISATEPVGHDEGSWRRYWSLISYIASELVYAIASYLKSLSSDVRRELAVSVRVKVVNYPEYFLPVGDEARDLMLKSVKRIREVGGEFGLAFMFTNTYHPVGREGTPKDLDELKLLGMAKVDVDRLGDVKALYSLSPSRLVCLSDLLNIAFGAKAYLYIIDKASKLGSFDVIILYGGGDDIAFYGEWSDVIEFVDDIIKTVAEEVIRPLTVSAGVVLAGVKIPVLEIYRDVVSEYLESKAKAIRNSIALNLNIRRLTKCGVVESLPPFRGAWGFDDDWNYRSLVEVARVTRDLSKLLNYGVPMRLLYTLTSLAARATDLVGLRDSTEVLTSKARLLVAYAELWSRSPTKEGLIRLNDFLRSIVGYTLPKYPSSSVSADKVINILSKAAPVLNMLLLSLKFAHTTSAIGK